jgi:hypothetical protein
MVTTAFFSVILVHYYRSHYPTQMYCHTISNVRNNCPTRQALHQHKPWYLRFQHTLLPDCTKRGKCNTRLDHEPHLHCVTSYIPSSSTPTSTSQSQHKQPCLITVRTTQDIISPNLQFSPNTKSYVLLPCRTHRPTSLSKAKSP